MAGGGQDLGSATFRVTLDDSDLRNKLKTLKADIEALKVGPVKLNADGTGTRSRTNPPAREPRQPREQRQPARGIDRAPLQGSVREVGSPAFGTRGASMGGSSESIDTLIKSKKTRYKLDQQIRALERDGVNTSKLRAQLGEATTAQAQRQFGAFKQITNSLQFAVTKEKDRLKVAKQVTAEADKQDKQTRRVAKENASPVRGGIGFDKSPIAKEIAARKQAKLTKDLDAGAMERAANRKAKIADRIDYLSTGGRDQSVKSAAAPLKANAAAIKAEELLDKARKATAATTEKDARRIAKDNAQPIGGTKRNKDSPAFKAAEEERTRLRIERRAKKISDRQDYFATGGRDQQTLRQMAVPSAGDPAARTRARQQAAADRKNAAADKQRKQEQGARLNSGLVGGAFPLMFGQGGFAAAGGALGGSVGGGELGFGLSLVGTFVGSQIDELNKRLGELGTALRAPIESLDVFIAQATLASSVQDKLAKTLVEGGQLGSAEQLIRTESARTVDPIVAEGVAANNEKFNRALSDTKDILGQLTAGPTSAFLAFLADLLNTVNNVPAANPDIPAGERLAATKKKATEDKQAGQRNAALGLALGMTNPFSQVLGVVGQGQASFSEGTERAASSKEVLALETRLTKEKQTQKSLEAAALQAKGQGRKELADTLSAQAKLAAFQVELTAGESAIAQELARNKDGWNDDKDQQFANNQRKDLRERIKLQKELAEAESSAAAASSVIAAKKAKDLQGFEGGARLIKDKELDVEIARQKTKEARSALDNSTLAGRKVAADGLTTAKNNQFIAQIDLERTQLSQQNDLNQSLQSELIIRKGIAQQITAAVAQQGAALAKADSGANPGNSVLAARAGRAEGDAFKEQNKAGINAAKSNESQLRSALQFNLDNSKTTELVSKIQTAAEATKLAYIEAGTALAEKIGAASASLAGMRDSLRGTLEGNIDLIPGQDIQNLRNMAQADINRGQQKGILRSDLGPAQDDKERFRQAGFVRDVENKTAQIKSQEELIKALNSNTTAERNITVQVELGGSAVPVGDRTASTL